MFPIFSRAFKNRTLPRQIANWECRPPVFSHSKYKDWSATLDRVPLPLLEDLVDCLGLKSCLLLHLRQFCGRESFDSGSVHPDGASFALAVAFAFALILALTLALTLALALALTLAVALAWDTQ